MKQLIKIDENKEIGKAVSARELYQFLGYNNSQWKRWYVKNIINNDFAVEGEDYLTFDIMSSSNNKSMTKEFALSVDFAKKLSMLARTEKGEIARNYFLEMERVAKANIMELPRIEILRMALEAEERTILLEQEIKIQAPKVQYFDKVMDSKSTYATTLIAKELGMGAVTLNKILHDCGVQHKIDSTWVLYHKYQGKGFTKTKTYTFIDSRGEQRTSMQTTWTEKGRHFIHEIVHGYRVQKTVESA